MNHDGLTSVAGSPHDKFITWLKTNNLQSYQKALEEEGYDDLATLSVMTQEEIDELSTSIGMKPGHRRKLPLLIKKAREEEEEQDEKQKVDKELARIERDRKLADSTTKEELARIERDQKLAEAKARSTTQEDTKEVESEDLITKDPVELPPGKRCKCF